MDVTASKFPIPLASSSVTGCPASAISQTTFAFVFSFMAASVLCAACRIMFVPRIMLLTNKKIIKSRMDLARFRVR